jgi:hypothetical protein
MFLTLLSALAVSAPAPKEIKPPKSPPPMVMVATVGKDGRAFVERTFIRLQPQIVEMKKGDKVEKREEFVSIQEAVRAFLDDKDVTVYGHKGQRIEAKELPKRIRKTMPVLVSTDGKEVDEFYRSIVREGTLIVVAPSLAGAPPPPIVNIPQRKQ